MTEEQIMDPRLRGGLPIITLIRPQMGENIGAVARAMSNFGLSELRIVAPRDGWPNDAAIAMAAHAAPIIHGATIYDDVPTALADIQHAYAATARPRDVEKRVLTPTQAVGELNQTGKKTAFVFGPERTGLTNDDLSFCHTIITIPTDVNASLNIAQSAVILGYEWFKHQTDDQILSAKKSSETAPLEQYEQFFKRLETSLDSTDFFKVAEKKPAMMQNIKAMFLRASHSEQELRTLHGILTALKEENAP